MEKKILFYPCCGDDDWKEAFKVFESDIDLFIFSDIKDLTRKIKLNIFGYQLKEDLITIESGKQRRYDRELKSFREIEVLKIIKKYISKKNEQFKEIHFYRDNAQYVLNDLENNSIDIFFHRGDSPGEGGSNLYFLEENKYLSKPYDDNFGDLYDVLAQKLKNSSRVVTDGSNSTKYEIKKFHDQKYLPEDTKSSMIGSNFSDKYFNWKCTNFISDRYGPTFIWELESKN